MMYFVLVSSLLLWDSTWPLQLDIFYVGSGSCTRLSGYSCQCACSTPYCQVFPRSFPFLSITIDWGSLGSISERAHQLTFLKVGIVHIMLLFILQGSFCHSFVSIHLSPSICISDICPKGWGDDPLSCDHIPLLLGRESSMSWFDMLWWVSRA